MGALPDRERRHLIQFYLLPKMGYLTRLELAGGLVVVGLALQLFWQTQEFTMMFIVTLPIVLAGNLFLLARGYNLAVEKVSVSGEWQKTTRDRFQKTRDLEKQVKKWDETAIDGTCVTGVFSFIAVALGVAGVWFLLNVILMEPHWAIVFPADAAAILLPHWFTGVRRGWKPVALRQEVDAVETALEAIEGFDEPPCQIQPMFEMGGREKKVPVGARAFVRFPDGPEAFLGVQFQVSLNDVQGTKFPYLYAVLVAKKGFGLLEDHLARIQAGASDELTVETSTEEDVDVVVIRQTTTKKTGYHTKDRAIRRIAGFAWDCTAEILSESGAAPRA